MTGSSGGFHVGFVGWMIALLAGAAVAVGGFEVLTLVIVVGGFVLWLKAVVDSFS